MGITKFLRSAFIAIIFISSGFEVALYAQAPPFISPQNWILDTSKSDEFNGTTLDSSKWWTIDPCVYSDSIRHGSNGAEGAFFRSENVSVSNGNLVLTVDYNPDSLNFFFPCVHYHTYPFYSGSVASAPVYWSPDVGVVGRYSYGYYEMHAQLPGYYDTANKPVGYGFFPTFWIAYQYINNHCILKQDEVDILEVGPEQYYDAKTDDAGLWDETDTCTAYKAIEDSVRSPVPLFDGYHKFALELLPDKIILYLDDQPFYSADTLTSPGLAHKINMAPYLGVNFDLYMGGYDHASHPYPGAPFPEYMKIDYFRYYELNPSYYTNNIIYQNSPNPFTSTTNISYSIASNSSNSFINIYNMLGMQVKSIRLLEKGQSQITLDNSDLSSGVYLYNLVVDNNIIGSKKLIVLK